MPRLRYILEPQPTKPRFVLEPAGALAEEAVTLNARQRAEVQARVQQLRTQDAQARRAIAEARAEAAQPRLLRQPIRYATQPVVAGPTIFPRAPGRREGQIGSFRYVPGAITGPGTTPTLSRLTATLVEGVGVGGPTLIAGGAGERAVEHATGEALRRGAARFARPGLSAVERAAAQREAIAALRPTTRMVQPGAVPMQRPVPPRMGAVPPAPAAPITEQAGIRRPVAANIPIASGVRPPLASQGDEVIHKATGNTFVVEGRGPRGYTLVDKQTGMKRITAGFDDVVLVPKGAPGLSQVVPTHPTAPPRFVLEGAEEGAKPAGQQLGILGERPEIGTQGARPVFGAAQPPKGPKPSVELRLTEFVRRNGGIRPEGVHAGEISAFTRKEAGTTGLVSKKGLTATQMAERASEAGFPVKSGEGGELLARLSDDLAGRSVLSAQSVTRLEEEAARQTARHYRTVSEGVGALDYLSDESGAMRVAAASERAGHVTILKPPRDLTPWGKWFGSPSKVFDLDPAAKQIQGRAVAFETAYKRGAQRFLALREEATKGLTNQQKLRVLEALDAETVAGQRIATPLLHLQGNAERAAYQEIRENILNELLRRFQQRGQAGVGVQDYFPHVFRGRWRLEIEGVPEASRFFETSGQAVTEARKALDATPAANVVVRYEGVAFPEEVATLLSRKGYYRLVAQIQKALGGKSIITKDEIIRATRGAAAIKRPPERYFGHLQPRISNLQTFDHDLDRALDTYIVGAVKKLETDAFRADAAKLRGQINPDLRNLLTEVDDYVSDVTGLPGATEAALDSWLVRTFGVRERALRRWSGGTAGFVAKLKLGYNPISAAINLSQTVVNTYPVLGARWARAGITGAVDHFRLGTQSKYAQLVDALGIRFYDSKAFGLDLVTVVGKERPVQALYMFNKAEEVNRVVAGIGAYERAIGELKLLPADAIEYARGVVQRTQFTYSASDLPKLLRNPMGRVLGQFRAFTIKELEFMHSLRGVEIPRFVIGAAVTGSLVVTPHVLAANAILKKATGTDVLADLRERFPRLVRGMPALFGIDLSERIGIGTDIEFTVADPKIERILGPAVGTGTEVFRAGRNYAENPTEENALDFIRALAPTQFRYLLNAYEAAAKKAGVSVKEVGRVLSAAKQGGMLTDSRGRPVTDVSPGELALKGIGFRTVREGQIRDLVGRAVERENEVERIRRNAMDRAFELREQGRPWGQAIRDANTRLPPGSRITTEQAERGFAIRRRLLPQRTLRRLPKGLRPEFRERFQQLEKP